jgi:ABC-type transporter Mla subunit MlaD
MSEKISQRLQELRQEFESGQKMLAELDAKKADLQQTLLRISGAIQVLEEMLAAEEPTTEPSEME